MAEIGQVCYNVIGLDGEPLPDTLLKNIYENIIPTGKKWKKIGVQAPPGSKIIFNKNKEIMVGRTGIYEIDEDIPAVEQMYFERPRKYKLNTTATSNALATGEQLLNKAETERDRRLNALAAMDLSDDEYWAQYVIIDEDFRTSSDYVSGIESYKAGANGIYELDGYGDLINVIIDYIQE